jgi:uncharacterized membrane protein YebE (DUF533 family)
MQRLRPEQIRNGSPEELARAASAFDEVIVALRSYAERDEAIDELERAIIDERLQLLGSTAA